MRDRNLVVIICQEVNKFVYFLCNISYWRILARKDFFPHLGLFRVMLARDLARELDY